MLPSIYHFLKLSLNYVSLSYNTTLCESRIYAIYHVRIKAHRSRQYAAQTRTVSSINFAIPASLMRWFHSGGWQSVVVNRQINGRVRKLYEQDGADANSSAAIVKPVLRPTILHIERRAVAQTVPSRSPGGTLREESDGQRRWLSRSVESHQATIISDVRPVKKDAMENLLRGQDCQ